MQEEGLEQRLREIRDRGVVIVDARQTYVDDDVDLDRLSPGAVLYPGTRLQGPRTLLGPGAHVGSEGPATLIDAVLGERASVRSGYVEGAVLLRDAVAGNAAHFRAGTLLEEEASTAHAVGLKHTILLSFVTLGSLINFCDVLMAGGTSRKDHSEVGSGFIHFNFTPWGKRGDKATPSLVGEVTRGVFLRERRIFLGGAGGIIGPLRVGYGGLTAAGSVLRRSVAASTLVAEGVRRLSREFPKGSVDGVRRAGPNVLYIANLVALAHWYKEVRLRRALLAGEEAVGTQLVEAAIDTIELALGERQARLVSFLEERGAKAPRWHTPDVGACPLDVGRDPELDHVRWVQSLPDERVTEGVEWLQAIVNAVVLQCDPELRPAGEGA